MHGSMIRRVFLPLALIVVGSIIFMSTSRGSRVNELRKMYASTMEKMPSNISALPPAVMSDAPGSELNNPLYDYTYDKMVHLSATKKKAKDPCVDVSLPDGGSMATSGQGLTVLVTGGAGFIGSNLVDRLLQLQYKVRIFDNLYTGSIRNVPLDNPDVEFFYGDILDKDALAKAVKGVDYVYHLAAMSKVVPSVKNPDMARFCTESNALGSWNVLDAVRREGNVQKVIYAGSSTYYGNKAPPHREDMAPDFLTPYAASKYEGEIQMQMFDRLFKVPTVTNRFFMVYGPRQPSTGAYAIVTGVFAKQAADGRSLTIEGDGTHYRDFIHVSDIVEGLILSEQSTELHGEVINLGSGSAFSVQDVANLVSSNQVHVAPRENDLEGTLADTCKMKRLLNYRTTKDFKTEMAYMAKQTMEGNVFPQEWLTPAHMLSAPHVLGAGNGAAIFNWPTKHNDLDALLLAIKHVEEKALLDGETSSHRMSVLTFNVTGEDVERAGDVLLNTIFSLVRFGGVKAYMVVTHDDVSLEACTTLNLPCYDASAVTMPKLLHNLVAASWDVHVVQPGNSYISEVDGAFKSVMAAKGSLNVAGASGQGDIFIRANDRSKAALAKWAQSTSADITSDLYVLEKWPTGDLTKGSYATKRYCEGEWVDPSKMTSSSKRSTKSSSSSSDSDSDSSSSEKSLLSSLSSSSSKSSSKKSSSSSSYSSMSQDFTCDKGFYMAAGCGAQPQGSNETISSLKAIGAWHLSECADKEHCDRQQFVPLRWISQPADLDAKGGMC